MNTAESHVFPRVMNQRLPMAARASGCWIEDDQGKRYLDASGGAIVVNIGHGRKQIADVVAAQLQSHAYVHPTMFRTRVVDDLATRLAQYAPAGIDRFYFHSSGSEAVETAIKMARQIHLANGQAQRFKLISRWKSYHGLTLGALAATGRTVFRIPFAPMLTETMHIAPPYCLRCSYGLSYPACNLRCAHALEETILNMGADTVSAFIAETVSGGTLAAYPPPPDYWPTIRDICDRHGVLLILDEVLCGMGRTGRWFACEHYGIAPDLITMGKGLTGGALPLSAIGIQGGHYDRLENSAGGFIHGGTFSHHPVAAAAALETIRILEQEQLVETAAASGAVLGDLLKNRLADHPHVADVRGIGMLWGVELVADKATNTPFTRSAKIAEKVFQAAFDRGVIVYKATGLAGTDGDAFLVAPPFIIEEKEMVLAVDTIQAALADVM